MTSAASNGPPNDHSVEAQHTIADQRESSCPEIAQGQNGPGFSKESKMRSSPLSLKDRVSALRADWLFDTHSAKPLATPRTTIFHESLGNLKTQRWEPAVSAKNVRKKTGRSS
jgi:hypothetical protein